MSTTALDVAAYIRSRIGYTPTNRRLQKLVYFSQAWTVGWTGNRLFSDDFEAWPDGPVERELWKCQRYGSVPPYRGQLSPYEVELVEAVLSEYADRAENELVQLSHEDVWSEARGGLPAGAASRNQLNLDTMKRYYVRLAIRGAGPKREGTPAVSAGSVGDTAAAVIERWRDGLALLATK